MTLPPLPDDRRYSHDAHYSADQMRAYGEACAAAERERAAKLCEQADKSTHPSDLADAIRGQA